MPDFHLNGQPLRWRDGLTVAALLAEQGRPPESVATAVNGRFVPRSQRECAVIQPGDDVTLIQPITGG